MDWATIIITVAPILSAFAWVYCRIDKKIEKLDQKIEKLDQKLDQTSKELNQKIDLVSEKVGRLDTRVSRIEGILSVRENWWEHHHKDAKEG